MLTSSEWSNTIFWSCSESYYITQNTGDGERGIGGAFVFNSYSKWKLVIGVLNDTVLFLGLTIYNMGRNDGEIKRNNLKVI